MRVLILALISFALFTWVLLPVRAQGISMEPTYEPGTFHLVNRLAFRWRDPVRGDVVAIRLAGTRVVYVKRIIGLPGEKLRIEAGPHRVEVKEPGFDTLAFSVRIEPDRTTTYRGELKKAP